MFNTIIETIYNTIVTNGQAIADAMLNLDSVKFFNIMYFVIGCLVMAIVLTIIMTIREIYKSIKEGIEEAKLDKQMKELEEKYTIELGK